MNKPLNFPSIFLPQASLFRMYSNMTLSFLQSPKVFYKMITFSRLKGLIRGVKMTINKHHPF